MAGRQCCEQVPSSSTLSGPPESFPDLSNPTKRQMLVRAVHASLGLPSSYPLGNIQLWIQTETSVAAPPARHLLSTNKVLVLGYTLIQTTELPSTPELQATLASPAAVEAIAQSLEQDGFIAPEHAGSVFVGLSTAGPDDIVNQITSSVPSAANNGTNLGQPAVAQFVPIGRRNCQGSWTAWSACSAACGGGTSTRSYTVTVTARAGGRECPVADGATETEPCNTEACPLDCIGAPSYDGAQYATWGCISEGTAHAGSCVGTCIGDSAVTSATCVNGTYSADTECVAVCLSAPPAVSNGSLVCSNTTAAGSNCTGTCNAGFRGNPAVTCQSNGTWSNAEGSCELIVCLDSPPAPANATFGCGASSLPNTTCNATCQAGYRGAASAICQKNGTWSAVDGGCSLIVCADAPPAPANGTFSCGADSLPGSNCSATCSAGYRGAPTVTCQQDGSWGDVEGDCELIVCPDNPVNPDNGCFSCGASSLPNTTCNATCNGGYQGVPLATCQEDGSWGTVFGECTLIVCSEAPQAISDGTFNCSTHSLPGSTCTAACRTGYRGTPTVTCQQDGLWGDVSGSCELIVCPGSPLAPANANFSCGISSLPNTTCNATCDDGYQGAGSATCQEDGTWSAVGGGCTLLVCSEAPPTIGNGTFNCSTDTIPGRNCSGSCNAGFRGTPNVTCQAGGLWGSITGTCEQIVCSGSPEHPANGTFACGASSLPGARCNATCSNGYRGSPSATCAADGSWGTVTGACTQTVCSGNPSNPANGTFSCGASSMPGVTCNGTCSSGYTGSFSATCGADGSWGAVTGSCTRIVCNNRPVNPANGTFGSCANPTAYYGTCAGSCTQGFMGTLNARCTGVNTWTTDNQRQATDAVFFSIGGSFDGTNMIAATVRYINLSAASPVWVSAPDLNVVRVSPSSTAMYSGMANAWGKYIYVLGGTDDLSDPGNALFFNSIMMRLDVTSISDGWKQVQLQGDSSPPANSRWAGVSATLDGIFYYVLGWDFTSGEPAVYTSSFDPATDTWTNSVDGATLPNDVKSSASLDPTARGCLVALGSSLYFMRYTFLLKWAPGNTTWTIITNNPAWPQSGNPACAAYDGKVVHMDGTTSTTYDPVTGAFATLTDTGARSHNHPVAQTCVSSKDPQGTIVAPIGLGLSPIQLDKYKNGTWAGLPDFPANAGLQTSQYMTTVCVAVPEPSIADG